MDGRGTAGWSYNARALDMGRPWLCGMLGSRE
jgi:hypothetical protein